MNRMSPPPLPPDDVDHVFGRLAPLPAPRGFATAVMAAIAERQTVLLSGRWLAAAAACVLGVLVLAYWVGLTLMGGGLLELVASLGVERDLLLEAPGEILLAVLDAIPWLELAGLVLALLALSISLRHLVRPAPGLPETVPITGSRAEVGP